MESGGLNHALEALKQIYLPPGMKGGWNAFNDSRCAALQGSLKCPS